MNYDQITVFYKWTALPGKLDELKIIYNEVLKEMKNNEPNTLKMHCYVDTKNNALLVNDLFKNAEALGYHLGVTAASHFAKLLEIATPGPFFFCGNVPTELKQAAEEMNMGAEFSAYTFGFERRLTDAV